MAGGLLALANGLPCAASPGNVEWEGGVTAILQHADDSRVDTELTASADVFVTFVRNKGEWLLYFEGSTTPAANGVSALFPTANADAGSVLNRDGDGRVQISELNYTFHLERNRSLMVGLVNPSAWLDRSRITNDENTHFISGSFKNNTTIEFPDYTLGAIMHWPASATRPAIVAVVARSAGLADLPDRSYQDLLNLSSDRRGLFVGADAGWQRERTALRFGAWMRSEKHAVLANPDETRKNYGIFGVFGWHVGDSALSVRLGAANDDVSVATRFAALAYQRTTGFGLFGIGVARTRLANRFLEARAHDVSSAEAFLRIPVGDGRAQVSPSIQYVENPGFDPGGATIGSSAFVAGVRFHWYVEK